MVMHLQFEEEIDGSVLEAFKRWEEAIKENDWIEFVSVAMYGALEKNTTHLKWEGCDLIIRFEDGTEATFTNAWPNGIEALSDAANLEVPLTYDFK
jgi:hypothetical protein